MMAGASEETLAVPARRGGGWSRLGLVLRARDDWLETFGEEAYEAPFLEQRLLWRRNLVINDPAAVKQVLLDNAANYGKTAIARRLLEPGLGKGLITMEGENWRRHRRILAPSFDHQRIAAYAPMMLAAADAVLADWDRRPDGAVVDMAQQMNRMALAIIARTMFSLGPDALAHDVAQAVRVYQEKLRPSLLDLLGLPEWLPRLRQQWGARRSLSGFHAAIERIIAARRERPGGGRQDLLWRLLAARDDEGRGLTGTEVHDHVVTILMAGHETVSVALAWTWYLLARHPREEARLHAELDGVLAGRAPGHDDLARLSYTRMVLEESMRLYPPAHTMSRVALGDDVLCGRRVRKGTVLLILPWLLHRHRRLWERPERFEPERFHPDRAEARPRFAYIPFGAGPRICIGAAFAMTEAMLTLARLAQRYRARLVPGHPVEPHGLITLRARHGIRMVLERRA
ncbi:MAG TPA: cytochrome P450 [Stellaceae bacterium]|nr:cytochrome P450 [Stellaceae bacterium]